MKTYYQALLVVSAGVVVGCGEGNPTTYPVVGLVAFPDGTTLVNGGQVLFISTDLSPRVKATGFFGPDGKFELTTFTPADGAIAAHYRVAVIPKILEDHEDSLVSARDYAKAMQPIDDRYRDTGASGIEFDVTAEGSPHNFRVEVTEPRRRRR